MFEKILIANRGEIAIRLMRACREMGIKSVAIYSDADNDALFARYADEAYHVGPSPAAKSYLNIKEIIRIARECGANAIHPGYGFLSENPNFAYACEKAGITFIGPSSHVIALMGNKVEARRHMKKAGVPVMPGTEECVTDFSTARDTAHSIGYPVIIKPSGGGGGIGMIIAKSDDELKAALEQSTAIAKTTFGLSDVYLEKYITNPRHIEFQILGDSHGNVIHLGERECSIQRRRQKMIEECPSPVLTTEMRSKMGEIAVTAAKAIEYRGAGTIEFIYDNGSFYFLEMNTRIQVEHPVTEMVTGMDIAKEQIRIAAGEKLSMKQEDVRMNGWAIECRINAEDPLNNFAPSHGKLQGYRSAGGIGIRVDSGVHTRFTIPYHYDPMISKLCAWGRDREEAIKRMRRALYESIIIGVKTNIPFLKAVLQNPRFVAGDLGTHFITRETTLLDDMKRIMEVEQPLEEKLSHIFQEKRRIAAIAAVSAITQAYTQPKSDQE